MEERRWEDLFAECGIILGKSEEERDQGKALGTEDAVARKENSEGRTCKSLWLLSSVGGKEEVFMFIEHQGLGPVLGKLNSVCGGAGL